MAQRGIGRRSARTDLAEELGGVSEVLSERVSSGLVYMMPSTRDTQYIWDPLSSLFNDVATDNTTRDAPVYTTKEALRGALEKLCFRHPFGDGGRRHLVKEAHHAGKTPGFCAGKPVLRLPRPAELHLHGAGAALLPPVRKRRAFTAL